MCPTKSKSDVLIFKVMKNICTRIDAMMARAEDMSKATAKIILIIFLLLFAENSRGTPPRAKEFSTKDWYDDLQLITYVMVGLLMINTFIQRYKKVFDPNVQKVANISKAKPEDTKKTKGIKILRSRFSAKS